MGEVFISYSRKDSIFVHRLKDALETTGYTTWVDWDDIEPTEEWWQRIEAGIDAATVVVFVMSPDSLKSEVCHKELAHALKQKKRVIPILRRKLDHKVLENDWAHKNWENTARENKQWLDAHHWIHFRKKAGCDCQYDEVTHAVINPECDGELSDADPFNTSFVSLLRVIEVNPESWREHAELLSKAQDWNQNSNKKELLLRGEQLDQAAKWLDYPADTEPSLAQIQRQFIEASLLNAKHVKRLRRWVTITLVGLVIGLLVTGIIAYMIEQQRIETDQLEKIARSINWHTSGTNSYRLGDFTTAQANHERALAILSDNPGLADHPLFAQLNINLVNWYNDLAVACLQTKDFDCAQQNLDEALRQDPNNDYSYLNLAMLSRDQQPSDYTAIEDFLTQACSSEPADSFIKYICTRIELSVTFSLDDWEGVIKQYLQSKETLDNFARSVDTAEANILSPFQLEILYYVAVSYEELGMEQEACPYWLDYIHISVQFPPAYRTLGDSERAKNADDRISASACNF